MDNEMTMIMKMTTSRTMIMKMTDYNNDDEIFFLLLFDIIPVVVSIPILYYYWLQTKPGSPILGPPLWSSVGDLASLGSLEFFVFVFVFVFCFFERETTVIHNIQWRTEMIDYKRTRRRRRRRKYSMRIQSQTKPSYVCFPGI